MVEGCPPSLRFGAVAPELNAEAEKLVIKASANHRYFFGSHNSMRLPSGSVIHANRP